MSREQVIARLRKLQNGRTLAVFGAEIGISGPFLSDMYAGKRGLGKKVLAYLHVVADPPTYSDVLAATAPAPAEPEWEDDDVSPRIPLPASNPWK